MTLAALPPLNIVRIAATTGANNPSDDYIAYFVSGLVDRVAAGTYDWRGYLSDSFVVAHSGAVPVLLRILLIRLAEWNIYGELYLTAILTLLRVLLIQRALVRPSDPRWAPWVLLPVLSGLAFSTSQVNYFTYGDAGLFLGCYQLALAGCAWALVRLPPGTGTVAVVAACALVGTWSNGSGLALWPVYTGALLVAGYRRAVHLAVWAGGALLAVYPYVSKLLLERSSAGRRGAVRWLDLPLLLQGLGSPFADDLAGRPYDWLCAARGGSPGALAVGFDAGAASAKGALLILLLTAAVILWRRGGAGGDRRLLAAASIAAAGLVNGWQIAAFRHSIAPWYTTTFLVPWVGLVLLSYVIVCRVPGQAVVRRGSLVQLDLARRAEILPLVLGGLVLATLLAFYLPSNLTYEDKVWHLYSRSPSSAACLRHYREAPDACQELVFQWPVSRADLEIMGGALERHRLAVFASRQRWSLQGDFVLDRVRLERDPHQREPFWTKDRTEEGRRSFRDYHHLNLVLPTPTAVEWRLRVPAEARRADLHSAAAISESAPASPHADGVTFEVWLREPGGEPRQAFTHRVGPAATRWHPFVLPLASFAGREVTVRFTSSRNGNLVGDWAMYRHPYVDVELDPGAVPPGTDARAEAPAPGVRDLRLDPKDATSWSTRDLVPNAAGGPGGWIAHGRPSLEYLRPLRACLADYTHLYVRLAVAPQPSHRSLHVDLELGSRTVWVDMPLRTDGDLHEYTYELKLLELDHQARLTGVRLAPVKEAPHARPVQVRDLRLLAGPEGRPSFCR